MFEDWRRIWNDEFTCTVNGEYGRPGGRTGPIRHHAGVLPRVFGSDGFYGQLLGALARARNDDILLVGGDGLIIEHELDVHGKIALDDVALNRGDVAGVQGILAERKHANQRSNYIHWI